jgi:hypothetical protein
LGIVDGGNGEGRFPIGHRIEDKQMNGVIAHKSHLGLTSPSSFLKYDKLCHIYFVKIRIVLEGKMEPRDEV